MTKMDLIPYHVAEEENQCVDEAIPILVRKEIITKAYKETMIQDIEIIDTYETRTKVNIPQWRPIYEVIGEAYIKGSKISLMTLLKNVK